MNKEEIHVTRNKRHDMFTFDYERGMRPISVRVHNTQAQNIKRKHKLLGPECSNARLKKEVCKK